jgi:MFS family permease
MAGTRRVITTIGILQILAWGSSFYLLTILAPAITAQTGWPSAFVVSGLSLALLVAGLVSPPVGHTIQRFGGRPVLAASSVLFAIGLASLRSHQFCLSILPVGA